MTQTTQSETTTTRPYPTIEDKVALFEDHGIKIDNFYKVDTSNSSRLDYDSVQVLSLDGGKQASDSAIAVAKAAGVKILALRILIGFNDEGEPSDFLKCYDLVFPDVEITQRPVPPPNF